MSISLTSQEMKVLGFIFLMVVLGGVVLAINKHQGEMNAVGLPPTPGIVQNGYGVTELSGPEVILPPNLNKASQEELARIPSIGPVFAQRICDYRQKHGPFKNIDDLKKVPGVDKTRFLQLKTVFTAIKTAQ
jgi:competence protein ComEA